MSRLLKRAANALAFLVVLPAVAAYRVSATVIGSERAFPFWTEALSLVPGLVGQYIRRAFYRSVLQRCGDGACIGFGVTFSHATASIGKDVYVGTSCRLGDVTLEDDVLIGSHVSVMNGSRQHGTDRLDVPIREQPGVFEAVTIGRDSWIGERAIVSASVGRHCIVGAGAVVNRPLPDFAVAVGVPAKVIRFRNMPDDAVREDRPASLPELVHSR